MQSYQKKSEKIIDNNLTKRRIKFGNTIKNHLAKNGYYPDHSWKGLKDIVDILNDKLIFVIYLLKKEAYNPSEME